MKNWLDLNYVQPFQSLPDTLFSYVQPRGLEAPKLVVKSAACSQLIGLDAQCLEEPISLKLLSGNGVLNTWKPLAMKYTGHQFGYYNPDLGDGRGLLLTQVEHNQQTWDLHLKGAGSTPYSRQGDGRAVLRSSIREFLCSEALAALSIPTTRALCVIDSESPVYRETAETGATILRVAKSHIRFGHFEYCSFTKQHDLLKTLCDHTITQYFPALLKQSNDNIYATFYQEVLKRTAKLMAHWQSIGFAHGVMNTDNMSIIGDTFDFGPFAFLDDFDPAFICNHSDHQGRYAFNQQPNIANWNLAVLAQALLPLASKESLVSILETYSETFQQYFIELMLPKLGLTENNELNLSVIEQTLAMLTQCKLDYTFFFRSLGNIHNQTTHEELRNMSLDISAFDEWFSLYQNALEESGQPLNSQHDSERQQAMNRVNPKYILRNYLAQEAIEAAQQGDYAKVQTLHTVLLNPFDEQPEFESYAALPPDWGKALEISCSS